jgi:hypothetical protein
MIQREIFKLRKLLLASEARVFAQKWETIAAAMRRGTAAIMAMENDISDDSSACFDSDKLLTAAAAAAAAALTVAVVAGLA